MDIYIYHDIQLDYQFYHINKLLEPITSYRTPLIGQLTKANSFDCCDFTTTNTIFLHNNLIIIHINSIISYQLYINCFGLIDNKSGKKLIKIDRN